MNYESDVEGGLEVGESSQREHKNQTQNRGDKDKCKLVKTDSGNSDIESLSHVKSYARAVTGE